MYTNIYEYGNIQNILESNSKKVYHIRIQEKKTKQYVNQSTQLIDGSPLRHIKRSSICLNVKIGTQLQENQKQCKQEQDNQINTFKLQKSKLMNRLKQMLKKGYKRYTQFISTLRGSIKCSSGDMNGIHLW